VCLPASEKFGFSICRGPVDGPGAPCCRNDLLGGLRNLSDLCEPFAFA
jgi:hypothetical protein